MLTVGETKRMLGKNILIGDDDRDIRELLAAILQTEGCRTFMAPDGEEAVDLVRNNPMDAAIIDLRMPRMDGLEALKRIKAYDETVEVLIMTAHPDTESLSQIIDHAAFDYILKPFHEGEISFAIKSAIKRRDFVLQNRRLKRELEDRIVEMEREFDERTRQLRESQIKYKQIVENSNDAILVAQDGMLKFVNPKALELTGYTSEEIMDLPFWELIHPEERIKVKERNLKGLRGEDRPAGCALRAVRKGGESVWVEISAIKTMWEGRAATLHFIRDITERRRAEESLNQSQERYRALFDRTPYCVYVHDFKGQFMDANEATLKVLGYTREEVPSINTSTLIGEEQWPIALKAMDEVWETGTQRRPSQFKFRRKDGRCVWVETEASLIYRDGEPYAIQGIARDITDRKRAEEALRQSEEKYRTILESIEDGYYETDLAGNFTFLNDSFCRILGYPEDELIGMNFRQHTDQETAQYVFQSFNRVYTTGETTRLVDYEAIRKDGSRRHVEVSTSLIRDSQGRAIGFRGIARDITDRKRMEAELIKTKNFLQNVLDSSIDGITTTDVRGNITYISPKAREMAGYDEGEIIGKRAHDLFHGGIEDARTIMKELMARGELRNREMKVRKKDGGMMDINLAASLMRDEKGEIIGTLGIYTDITEKKRLEAQLQEAQKMQAVGTLAGGIAHDFNNLLMGIQGYASLMLLDVDPSDPHYEQLKAIEHHVQSGSRLTQQLLGFARGGKYDLKPTDLNEILETTSRLFGRTRKEIRIHRKYQRDIWTVEIDRGQVQQVILNLLVNAWHAMPGGGDLYLETRNVTLRGEHVKSFDMKPGDYVEMSVTDAGVGMDKATQQRIFEPFFTTREMGRGNGLGLASAYGIIKNHGGIINVYTEKACGTRFNIYLPTSRREVAKERALTSDLVKGDATILLVEDEDAVRRVSGRLLKALGYGVIEARNGNEAVELYKANGDRIDLVILDMIMPGMDGGETYDRLKEIDAAIKVLLSSGYSVDGKANGILERGCNGFIQKPFDIKELSFKVREVLDAL